MSVLIKRITGLVPYARALTLQERLVDLRIRAAASSSPLPDLILLLEHRPVYTAGRRMKGSTGEEAERLRKTTDAEVHEVDRGGQMTFHGPGQLVGYPIIDLRTHKLGVAKYVALLETFMIRTCAEFNVKAGTTENTGVWVEGRKIAALGIHIRRHITSHGFALNCNTDLKWFDHIDPCGLKELGVTSLTEEVGRNVDVEEVIPVVLKCFSDVFDVETVEEADGGREIQKAIDEILAGPSS